MTGITKQQQQETHNLIDEAIKKSVEQSPDAVNEIARLTGQTAMMVLRRFRELGYVQKGGRWVYRHNGGTKDE